MVTSAALSFGSAAVPSSVDDEDDGEGSDEDDNESVANVFKLAGAVDFTAAEDDDYDLRGVRNVYHSSAYTKPTTAPRFIQPGIDGASFGSPIATSSIVSSGSEMS